MAEPGALGRRASIRMQAKMQKGEREALVAELQGMPEDALREEIARLESLVSLQTYKALTMDGDAHHALLQKRQDHLAVAREVLSARIAGADERHCHAVLMIQCQVRNHIARAEMRRRRVRRSSAFAEELDAAERNESALLIQGQMRQRAARKEAQRRRERRSRGLRPTDDAEAVAVADAAVPPRVHGTFADTAAASPVRNVPLQASAGALVPAYRVHDVSGVPTTEFELRQIFQELDSNCNGFISKDEFVGFYRRMETFGVEENDADLCEVLSRYKMLGDDKLSFDEFAILMLKVAQR
eukprot:TRINITY_DN3502_c2_g3_i1.p1 TRINITY_DN3502_c2_g3~~TRINITY_DN3502_c2_g3_i1.p1  ORF type:complete len:299 (+),score=121.16 TRINITY_DN3502_c2_g3_i1:99-995(+)